MNFGNGAGDTLPSQLQPPRYCGCATKPCNGECEGARAYAAWLNGKRDDQITKLVTIDGIERAVQIGPSDVVWERCAGPCGREYDAEYLCDKHRLCGICHVDVPI